MNIKLTRTCMVGKEAQKKGWTGPADDEEAKALITAGYAAEYKGVVEVADPNAAKAAEKDALLAVLDGTIAEVTEALAGVDKSQLKALAKLEGKGKDRAGVHAAIEAAASAE